MQQDHRRPRRGRGGPELFPHDVEIQFNDAYDKLLRAIDGLELSRDLIAGVRDYLQAKIANDQNEVMKKLTVIASLLLLPTFIVGVYGQNFQHHFPELHWHFGYACSWGLIVVTTIAAARGSSGGSAGSRAGYPGYVPYYICPNCKDRSVDLDGREGFSTRARRRASAAASASCSS